MKEEGFFFTFLTTWSTPTARLSFEELKPGMTKMTTTKFPCGCCTSTARFFGFESFDPCFPRRPIPKLKPNFIFASYHSSTSRNTTATATASRFGVRFQREPEQSRWSKRDRATKAAAAVTMLHQNPVVSDLLATGLSGVIALSLLRLWEETAKRRIFDQVNQYPLVLSFRFNIPHYEFTRIIIVLILKCSF